MSRAHARTHTSVFAVRFAFTLRVPRACACAVKYTVYNVNVVDASDQVHVIQRRFNEFRSLYQSLKDKHPEVGRGRVCGSGIAPLPLAPA